MMLFISSELVYLPMQKTGSTHTAIVLEKYFGGRHQPKRAFLENYDAFRQKFVVTSIRNPWDWYVSLWAFGCTGQGTLRYYIDNLPRSEFTEACRQRDPRTILTAAIRLRGRLRWGPDWLALYADPTNAANFRQWLKLLLGPEGRHISLEGYASSPVKKIVGFMTYRFLALTTEHSRWITQGRKCRTYCQVVRFGENHTIADRTLRMECLNDDLLDLLAALGAEVSADDAAGWGKHNSSVHRGYADYYDEETHQLVASSDRFIIEQFDYKPSAAERREPPR